MIGGHYQLNGHEFLANLRDSKGQGMLVCCSPCGSQTGGHDVVSENNNNISISFKQ